MNRKVKIFLTMALWITLSQWGHNLYGLYTGTIEFPSAVQKIPSIRIYYAGNKIKGRIDNESKKLNFDIPAYQKNDLYILITNKKIKWQAQENTIQHLKISPSGSYKLYKLTPIIEKIKFEERVKEWISEESFLETDGKIPDNTIIIIFDAEFIEHIEKESRSGVELPHLIVYNNILSIARSEEQLHVMTEALLLSSLDSDAIHRKIQLSVNKPTKKTTLIAPVA